MKIKRQINELSWFIKLVNYLSLSLIILSFHIKDPYICVDKKTPMRDILEIIFVTIQYLWEILKNLTSYLSETL